MKPASSDPYHLIGVQPLVNAAGYLSTLGNAIMAEPVLQAMVAASQSYVNLLLLQRSVGERIAVLTKNEGAYVCAGAAAGLYLAVLACITGSDERRIEQLPSLPRHSFEVVIYPQHRSPYDEILQLIGVRIVEPLSDSEPKSCLTASFTERTVAVIYLADLALLTDMMLPLTEITRLAHASNIPVIVDAAGQLPPVDNLWHFTRNVGVDLVIFSGGKDLHGPSSTGMILGRTALIEACVLNGPPHYRLGRMLKVGREEMMGLLAALEWYLAQDHESRRTRCVSITEHWLQSLANLIGIQAYRDLRDNLQASIIISIDPLLSVNAYTLAAHLEQGDPPIAIETIDRYHIGLSSVALAPGEEFVVIARITSALRTYHHSLLQPE
jgi:L-seryl-tRNA(Ser) seleniumtransferase